MNSEAHRSNYRGGARSYRAPHAREAERLDMRLEKVERAVQMLLEQRLAQLQQKDVQNSKAADTPRKKKSAKKISSSSDIHLDLSNGLDFGMKGSLGLGKRKFGFKLGNDYHKKEQ